MSSHKYPEAFLIMWYACPCGHQEKVWNSRDGVAPQAIVCSSCGKLARHVKPGPEEYNPHHKLHHGQKFFRDGTEEEARQIMEMRFEKAKASLSPSDLLRVSLEQKEAIEQAIHDPELWPPGWPVIDVNGELMEYGK